MRDMLGEYEMPFWRTYYHLVWGTKNQEPLITEAVESSLFPYLINRAVENGMRVYALNGWVDHVHMVSTIPPKLAVATVVKRLKGASSHYMNELNFIEQPFAWGRGYGVLTVGERHLDVAIGYVEKQKEHHRAQTINGWLESLNEADDGPTKDGLDRTDNILREDEAIYEVGAEWLF